MYDVFHELLGIDFYVSNDIQYCITAFVILFVVGEIFNIIRTLFRHIMGEQYGSFFTGWYLVN